MAETGALMQMGWDGWDGEHFRAKRVTLLKTL